MSARPSFDEMFMGIAHQVSTRSTCQRLKVGAVLVDTNNRIISTGYNGSPKNTPHCLDVGCLLNDQQRCVRCVHAELNALLVASRICLDGCTIYVTHQPCEGCIKAIIQVGITRVVYANSYVPSSPATLAAMQYFEQFVQLELLEHHST